MSRSHVGGLGIILLATMVILLPPYLSFFYFDDYKLVEFIRATAGKPWTAYQIASPYWIGWNYRPTQLWFNLANFLLFGVHPAGFYLAMVAVHLVNVTLLYALARLWRVGIFGALLAAALFAINFVHQDAVIWISSASIGLAAAASLLAVYSYSRYLFHGRRPKSLLWLSVLSVVLALLSREEAVVLPFILIAVWLLAPDRQRPMRSEIIAFLAILLSLGLYGYFQITRPTWGGIFEGDYVQRILDSLLDLGPLAVLGRSAIVLFLPSLASAEINQATMVIVGLISAALLLLWFLRGNRASRLGIAWAGLYLLGLFVLSSVLSLWLAPRYFYLPWIGLSLALGSTLERVTLRWPRYRTPLQIAILTALMLLLLYQTGQIRREQANVKAFVLDIDQVRRQMVDLIPNPDVDSNFFAYEFPPLADYIQAMAAIWYDLPFHGAGGWYQRLMQQGSADDQDYLLTYEDGTLINLMPELQQSRQTIFVWQKSPLVEMVGADGTSGLLPESNYLADQVAGPPGSRRLASFLHPPAPAEGWASLVFPVTVPENSSLSFGFRRESGGLAEEDGMIFRVRAIDAQGQSYLLFEQFADVNEHDENPWTDITIPVKEFWGQAIELRFETSAGENIIHDHGYWANPHFAIDPF